MIKRQKKGVLMNKNGVLESFPYINFGCERLPSCFSGDFMRTPIKLKFKHFLFPSFLNLFLVGMQTSRPSFVVVKLDSLSYRTEIRGPSSARIF